MPGGAFVAYGNARPLPSRARPGCSAPASAAHVAPIANLDNENDQSAVLNVRDHPVVADPVSPAATELAG